MASLFKKKGVIIATIVTLIVVVIVALGSFFSFLITPSFEFPERNVSYQVKIAETPSAIEQGLSGTKTLKDGEGMIFLFTEPGYYGFWMPEMNYPLDILWIEEGRVVHIEENVPNPPPGTPKSELKTYIPEAPASMVLEINAGEVEKHGIEVGDLTLFTR